MSEWATIDAFRGDYFFLSNFSCSVVSFWDWSYPTVEHAFQAAKTTSLQMRAIIGTAPTPGEAKRLGRGVELRPDWEGLKIPLMEHLLRQKFAPNSPNAGRLLATGDARLVEGNTWGDTFWGVCGGHGENWLGRLLMKVRTDLR